MMTNSQISTNIPTGKDSFYDDLAAIEAAKNPQEMAIAREAAIKSGLANHLTAKQSSQISDDDFEQALSEAEKSSEQARNSMLRDYAGSSALSGAADKDAKYDASDKKSMMGNLLLGGHIGLYELAARLAQLGIKFGEITKIYPKGMSDAVTKEFNRRYLQNPAYLKALKESPYATKVGEFLGENVPLLSVPESVFAKGGATAARLIPGLSKTAAPIAGKILAGIGIGGMTGAAQYDPTNKQGLYQTGLGAISGGLFPAALAGGAKAFGRPAIEEAVSKGAQQAGISLPTYPSTERMLATIPGSGVSGVIAKRGEKMAKGVQQTAQQIVQEAPGKNYAKDFTGSLLDELATNRTKETNLRNQIDQLAEKGGKTINPINFKIASSNALNDLQILPQNLRSSFTEKLTKEISPYENSPNLRYMQLDALKKQIGGQLDIANDASAGIPRYARSIYKKLYGSIKQDMNDFAEREGGDLKQLHNEADKLYQNKILPFSKAPYNKLITGDMSSKKFIGKFIKPDSEEDVDQLLKLMPSGNTKALTSARAAIIDSALEHADLPGAGFNGAKFANNAMKIDKATGNLLSPEQRETLKGYQALGNYLEKIAPQSTNLAKIKKSGLHGSLMHMGGLGLALYHPHIFLPIYTSGLAASTLFSTKAGQAILRSAARAGSTEMNPILRHTMNFLFAKFGTSIGSQ